MQLGNAYTSMDREYHDPVAASPEPILDVSEVGMSVPLGIAAADVAGINSKIMAGAGNLEIQFSGVGRGNRNQQTPGLYGTEERRAIRELSELNKVNMTTHASFGLFGMSGLGNEGFSEKQRSSTLKELKSTIDFAAEAANGGAVTIHTGEYPRPIASQKWARTEDNYVQFEEYENEEKKAVEYLVDKKTGQIFKTIRRDTELTVPVYQKDEQGNYLDIHGHKLINQEDVTQRVPIWDDKKKGFVTESRDWNYFEEEAMKYNEKLQPHQEPITAQEAFYRETLNAQEAQMRGLAAHHSQDYSETFEKLEKLKHEKKYWEEVEKNMDETAREHAVRNLQEQGALGTLGHFKKGMLPSELINDEMEHRTAHMKSMNETAASYQVQAEEVAKQKERITSIDKYAREQSIRSYAEAGLHAMARSKETSEPVFIAMEQIFPEQYGGHPQELKELIFDVRAKMEQDLIKQGRDKQEAHKLAEQHIKGTFDTAHANLWWKYYKQDPDKTLEENRTDFDKWLLNQAEDLAKSGVIGNLHISDNFGYEDDHLTPGTGNAPWAEMLKLFKKHGYKGAYTVEPKDDVKGLTEVWARLGSPVFSIYRPGSSRDTWTEVSHSYFGKTGPPNYLVGEMTPSPQEWTLWSGVPLE